jgi:hypothetical protein
MFPPGLGQGGDQDRNHDHGDSDTNQGGGKDGFSIKFVSGHHVPQCKDVQQFEFRRDVNGVREVIDA